MNVWISGWSHAESEALHFEQAAEWAASQLQTLNLVNPENAGLYLATRDAGAAASIGFWSHALDVGAGFANPRDFPWTLASSPAGYIALRLGLQGANYTLVGESAASHGALQHAMDDLDSGMVESALVVRFDMMDKVMLAAVWLTKAAMDTSVPFALELPPDAPADDLLVSLCEKLERTVVTPETHGAHT